MVPLWPQQKAFAVTGSRPHVWYWPPAREEKRQPPPTATGTLLSVVVPFPSCPAPLLPQQKASPLIDRPHV